MRLLVAPLLLQLGLGAIFSNVQPDTASASLQCQGNCQGDDQASQDAVGGLGRVIREQFNTGISAENSDAPATNTLSADQSTPVIEMIYNYILPQDQGASAASSAPTLASWLDAAADAATGSFASAESTSLTQRNTIWQASQTLSTVDVAYSQKSSEIGAAVGEFDVSSWGNRIDSAAHKLASNIGGIIINFQHTSAEPEDSSIIPVGRIENESAAHSGWFGL
ncbi:hypothetical protein GQ54DRAFT_319687 [Martensiomyces pterosporus]|nr:hypothetical protein GQ54DRAFT_319687 [Martensiomyces pterosporus]